MANSFRLWQRPTISAEVIERGLMVAMKPATMSQQPKKLKKQIAEVAHAITTAPHMEHQPVGKSRMSVPQPVAVSVLASRAAAALKPNADVMPADIELALRRQGLDWAEPFAPGRPLTPYYGYNRRPRGWNFPAGRNVTSETRPGRIPFGTLKQTIDNYDVAQTCIRHIISDVRSMPLRWGPIDGETGDVTKEIEQAQKFWKRPDGKRFFNDWLAMWLRDNLRYDAGALYKERNRAGKLLSLKVIDGTMIAPQVDYFGDIPVAPAPAYQQFVQGIPWNWMTTEDLIYMPMWPISESPYGEAAIETILVNANTDMRLQLFFLQFFTEGAVSEMLLEAPPDVSDPDALADYQEIWDNWMDGNQTKRHGARWIPSGAKPFIYKNIDQINPKIAEYVMRRTVSAFQLTPQDIGLTDQVNRATSDTQVDTQFRISTLPNTEHYEAIINAVTQEDLGLPLQGHFDTGRETEDRLVEAQAHQIYVSIGAESPDEVREDVLGKKTDNKSRVPRFFNSEKLGPVPIGYLIAASGPIDPETLAPYTVDIAPQPFVPAFGIHENVTPGQETGSDPENGGGGTRPLQIDEKTATNAKPVGPKISARDQKPAGSSQRATKVADLTKWRRQSKERVAKGQSPRAFENSEIDTHTYNRVWSSLQTAKSAEDVDAAFIKVRDPIVAGVALRAADTGRVLMIQRALLEGDLYGGCWEFPGGHLESGESAQEAAMREWEEETGMLLPQDSYKVAEWDSANGVYRGFVLEISNENSLDLSNRNDTTNPDGDHFEAVAWWAPSALSNNLQMRPELKADSQSVQHAIVTSRT